MTKLLQALKPLTIKKVGCVASGALALAAVICMASVGGDDASVPTSTSMPPLVQVEVHTEVPYTPTTIPASETPIPTLPPTATSDPEADAQAEYADVTASMITFYSIYIGMLTDLNNAAAEQPALFYDVEWVAEATEITDAIINNAESVAGLDAPAALSGVQDELELWATDAIVSMELYMEGVNTLDPTLIALSVDYLTDANEHMSIATALVEELLP